jgi:3-oxoacyl-[acyl-carrier protein] reductase
MDLGIAGRRAIVCASSKGLGRACALALAREGVALTMNARGVEALEDAARSIRVATGAKVATVVGDVTDVGVREALLHACPEPDILVTNAGGPPRGDGRAFGREDWVAALDQNMLTPIWLIRATIDGMIARGWGRVVNITSITVKAPIANLALSNGVRMGLTGFIAGLARQVVRHGVTINNLLPGSFETDRLREGIRNAAAASGENFEARRAAAMAEQPAKRFGVPDELGAACAFLCSAHAGFIAGQNVLIDGGAYTGTL